MAVIAISRQSGARGSYIGRKLAERLGYRYIDQVVIHEVCLEYGVRQDEFERIYQQAPGILERYERRNREIVQLIGRIIQGVARRNNMVIVARDAFVALREYGDVLNVRVTAGRRVRVQRIQQDQSLPSNQARKMLDRLDNERSKYLGAYYGLAWADADLYDLCVNTSKLAPDQAVELILQTLSLLESSRDPERRSAEAHERPLVQNLEADPILDLAIDEALSLLKAIGQIV